ncbi:MAG TPA: hypothetical protein VGX03_28915 [Candidatus Binatia bacterium]|jgi:hypothetical protein|nr:hypothetical protein [Candidatus Binatia bacterium]
MARKLTSQQRQALKNEAEAWDRLSDEDFARLFTEGKPVKVRPRRPAPKTLTIALDERTLNLLKRLARQKQVGPTHLAAMWIAERLAHEQL